MSILSGYTRCRALQFSRNIHSYFKVLNFEEKFKIDQSELKNRQRAMQREVHPDKEWFYRHELGTQHSKKFLEPCSNRTLKRSGSPRKTTKGGSLEQSSLINEAVRNLKSHHLRGLHLREYDSVCYFMANRHSTCFEIFYINVFQC